VYDLVAVASTPDLLRLVAVPVFAWAAVRDVKTRRISSDVWIPLSVLALALFLWEGTVAYRAGGLAWTQEFLVPATMSLGVVVPLAYLFWWFGGYGGADAKALLVIALLFPTVPTYTLVGVTFPFATPDLLTPFSLTILTNAVIFGAALPLVLAVRNAAAGRFDRVMIVGWPTHWREVGATHGRLLETPEGRTRRGLDLDALRMYLRWRGLDLETLRRDPDTYRDPASLPAEPNPPTDGAVHAVVGAETAGNDEPQTGSTSLESQAAPAAESDQGGTRGPAADPADPWGAEAFLADIEGTAYGTDPDTLRGGLEVLTSAERVWVSPGTPFLVPVFVGLLVALVYGDLLLSAVV